MVIVLGMAWVRPVRGGHDLREQVGALSLASGSGAACPLPEDGSTPVEDVGSVPVRPDQAGGEKLLDGAFDDF